MNHHPGIPFHASEFHKHMQFVKITLVILINKYLQLPSWPDIQHLALTIAEGLQPCCSSLLSASHSLTISPVSLTKSPPIYTIF